MCAVECHLEVRGRIVIVIGRLLASSSGAALARRGRAWRKRKESSRLIQNDEVMAQRLCQIVGKLMGRLRLLQLVDKVGDGDKTHAAIYAKL